MVGIMVVGVEGDKVGILVEGLIDGLLVGAFVIKVTGATVNTVVRTDAKDKMERKAKKFDMFGLY